MEDKLNKNFGLFYHKNVFFPQLSLRKTLTNIISFLFTKSSKGLIKQKTFFLPKE